MYVNLEKRLYFFACKNFLVDKVPFQYFSMQRVTNISYPFLSYVHLSHGTYLILSYPTPTMISYPLGKLYDTISLYLNGTKHDYSDVTKISNTSTKNVLPYYEVVFAHILEGPEFRKFRTQDTRSKDCLRPSVPIAFHSTRLHSIARPAARTSFTRTSFVTTRIYLEMYLSLRDRFAQDTTPLSKLILVSVAQRRAARRCERVREL